MTEAADSFDARGRDGRGAAPDRAVPQWLIDALRPCVRAVSRALWRVELKGTENIPAEGGLVIAANHQTYVDPFWITIPVERPVRYLAWSEAFKNPIMRRPLEWLGAWPLVVERGNPTAYRRSMRWLRGGGVVMIFPEGSRAYADGEFSKFKTGAVRLALEAGVPVLPVTLRGGNSVWPRDQRWPRTGHIVITYHPVHQLHMLPGEDARQCAKRETEALAEIIRNSGQ